MSILKYAPECPQCGTENVDNNEECLHCGYELPYNCVWAVCPDCGVENVEVGDSCVNCNCDLRLSV